MSNDPKDEIVHPLPQVEPSPQPEAQSILEVIPSNKFAPYIPLAKTEEKQQGAAFSLSRRATLGLLSVLAVGVAIEGYYLLAQQATQISQSSQSIQPMQPITAIPANPGIVLVDSPTAEITIEEYTDFACPYCARFANYIEEMRRDFGPRVRIVYRNLPRPAHGPIAETAARAFTAVSFQNPAVAYSYYNDLLGHQNLLYSNGEQFLYDTASKYDINIDRMKSDMTSKAVLDQIEQDKIRAKQAGVILTPSWIIGKQGLNGTFEYPYMKQVIEYQLSRK